MLDCAPPFDDDAAAILRFNYIATRFKRHFRFSDDRYTVYVHVDRGAGWIVRAYGACQHFHNLA